LSGTTRVTQVIAEIEWGEAPTPPAPTDCVATANVDASCVLVGWTDNAVNETGYEVQRRESSEGWVGPWMPLVNLPANSTSYLDCTAGLARVYEYRVRATLDSISASNWCTTAAVFALFPQVW
jgi:hypothetical protein